MKLHNLIFGGRKDLHDPKLFHDVSLIALFAWVGLGADGLSSSAYGPEEAYRALNGQIWLAIPLVMLTALTVAVISAGYNRIIKYFPFGGGGYAVASKLLGPNFGLVSSCALLVDYVLTIAISIASGADAVFSFLPAAWLPYKLAVIALAIGLLTWLNLRGAKESIKILTPIFLTFVFTHVIVIVAGILGHIDDAPAVIQATVSQGNESFTRIGVLGILAVLLRAYSMGGGTYTGIEAVSNGLAIMREPKVKTGQRTMFLMAVSLAFTAGGILLCYLLFHVAPQPGKTLNAVLLESFTGGWTLGGMHIGKTFVLIALASEAALLFVAAQTGFIGGPRVMANMANDSWMPHRFGALSESLTMHYGVLLMSGAALATVWHTHGSVSALVVMYSINVFLTFSLSEIAMLKFTWQKRRGRSGFKGDMAVFIFGSLMCVFILAVTVFEKFTEGGWLTLVTTAALIALCFLIRRHYLSVGTELKKLDGILEDLPSIEWQLAPAPLDPRKPVAALLVGGYSGIGVHSLLSIQRTFPGQFSSYIFVSVGVIDSATFQGVDEVRAVEKRTGESLRQYVNLAISLGLAAESRMTLDTEAVHGAVELCSNVAKEFPNVVFFGGKLIFQEETFYQRVLHNETALAIQKRLHFNGHKMMVLPITVESAVVMA